MTDKRFTLAYEQGNWWAVRDGDITLWKEEVIDLLNELHEENQDLKILFHNTVEAKYKCPYCQRKAFYCDFEVVE